MMHQSELERLAYRLGGALSTEEMAKVMPIVRKWAQELGKGAPHNKWAPADVYAEWKKQKFGPMWQVACALGVSEKTVSRKLTEHGINVRAHRNGLNHGNV
jgi:hypothetical protein